MPGRNMASQRLLRVLQMQQLDECVEDRRETLWRIRKYMVNKFRHE
jgi:hypothetical protein